MIELVGYLDLAVAIMLAPQNVPGRNNIMPDVNGQAAAPDKKLGTIGDNKIRKVNQDQPRHSDSLITTSALPSLPSKHT